MTKLACVFGIILLLSCGTKATTTKPHFDWPEKPHTESTRTPAAADAAPRQADANAHDADTP